MNKRELERQILAWSRQQAQQSGYEDQMAQRAYQTGLILGLLSSICDNDFWAKRRVLDKILPKDR